MNEAANRGGMIAFIFCMLFSVGFFAYITVKQPGPIDKIKFTSKGMTHEEYVQMRTDWMVSSPEKIQKGKKLFEMHFLPLLGDAGSKKLMSDITSGQFSNLSEIQFFQNVSDGLVVVKEGESQSRNKIDYLPEYDRWNMTHYFRSLMSGVSSASNREKEEYTQHGL